MRNFYKVLQVLLLALVLMLFFVSLELMGGAFKLMGRGFAEALLETTANPFVGLFIGILATSLVQSSSTVTAMTVSIVAGGGLTVAGAIPIIMGANVGTSVTNTVVSLGHVTRKDEFRRAMAGATVHDFFNLLTVAVFFPLELFFQIISRSSAFLTDALADVGGTEVLSPVKLLVEPIAGFFIGLAQGNGIAVLIIGLIFLFISLRYLVKLLHVLVLGRSEKMLHKYIFGTPIVALLFGVLLTVMVQSSTITTSVVVPLVGAGIVTVHHVFPFMLGANIGTTITAILAALVLASSGEIQGIAALKVAFAHLFFNMYGVLLFYPIRPLRMIPIRLAEALGDLSVKNRSYAFIYVISVFFILPLSMIFLTRNIDTDFYNPVIPQVLRGIDTTTVPLDPPAEELRLEAEP